MVANPDNSGMGRMWEIMASDKKMAATRTFKSVEEANSFLDSNG